MALPSNSVADSKNPDQMLHRYPDYLLIGQVDNNGTHKTPELLHFLQFCATPEASGSTVQTVEDRRFFECPLKDLEPNNAWMWRSYHEHCYFSCRALETCKDAAKSQNKLPSSEARVPTA